LVSPAKCIVGNIGSIVCITAVAAPWYVIMSFGHNTCKQLKSLGQTPEFISSECRN
jgi:hypothetical protein